MKKLKDLMREAMNPQLGKVYSDPYSTSFVKENEESTDDEFTSEQRDAFLEAVKQYKKYGESVYRKKGLTEVCESIKGLVEVANRVTIKETGDWFDGVTVSRHLKRMNESYKVFAKTLTEVDTLQQRMESSYDEIGEVLGKYYEIYNGDDDSEIEEGNEFGAARAKAIAAGSDSFEVDGKTYPLKGVDKDDKENAKEFTKESMNLTDILKEGKDVGHYERVGNQTIVDSNFVNYSKGVLPNSELVHLGMGDFAIKSQSGTIKFQRSGKMDGIGQDFVGRPHRMTDDKNGKLVDLFLKLMLKKKKAIISMSESVVNETRLVLIPKPDKGLSIGKQQELAKDILTFIDKSTKINLDYKKRNTVYKSRDRVYIELFPKTNSDVKIIHKFLDKMYPQFKIDESVVNEGMAGWIAIDHKGNKLEIKKSEAKDLYNAKLLAIKKLKVPKSKVGMLAIKPAVDESVVNEAKYDIGMARKGNGLTIYNKAEEENGDYKNVAHIDNKGKVKYLDKKIPSNIKKEIEAEAKKMMEITNEGNSMIKLKNLLNESMGLGDLPSSKLMKMKVSAKDMLASVGSNNINESEEDESANEDVYVKNKKTGNTYAVKNADPSKHEPPSEKEISNAKSDEKDEPNRGTSDSKDEPKKEAPKVKLSKDFDKLYYADDMKDEVEKLEDTISPENYKKIQSDLEDLKYAQEDAENAKDMDDDELEDAGMDVKSQDELDGMADELKDFIKQFGETESPKREPKSEPKQVPLDKYDGYYIKTAVEKKMGPAAFKALSYGDQQKAYNAEMDDQGWEKNSDGDYTKPNPDYKKESVNETKKRFQKLANIIKG